MMKKIALPGFVIICVAVMLFSGCASGNKGTSASLAKEQAGVNAASTTENANGTTLVYGSADYTRINPALDEHGEINSLIFDGLTEHDENNEVKPCLAKSWDYDESAHKYTFHLRDDVYWHDGKKFTADDVKFTIEAIMDPKNESEIASNYEDITSIDITDANTVSFTLKNTNAAFLDYMTIAILPKHCLEGENMQESAFFRAPVGTGPYKLVKWDAGQSIALAKNDRYFKGAPKIDNIVFKIVEDDNLQAVQLQTGEINMALITPALAQNFKTNSAYKVYTMDTSDYRGIMYNFNNDFWKNNRELIKAFNYAFDRKAMLDTVFLGEGEVAYGPLQMNKYNDASVEKYSYAPQRAKQLIEAAGWQMGNDGYYYKDGEKLSFVLTAKEGEQERIDLANIASQQLKAVGVECKVEITSNPDWESQSAYLIGWGSPFDADDHTYKVFGTGKGNNYSAYSNAKVDEYLTKARETFDVKEREKYYDLFQQELAADPAYSFFTYIDANYVTNEKISGITEKTLLGHHGVGIFWNVEQWSIEA